ncbi:hypothetical protein CFAM422_007517 [Trichoderma lentiforme]|uniref:Uncharacterized protein n=1 Tax=Trichoderma lentiforme TaxID=1567552 RepID=A0A9P5CCC1_9HYPO|nr:hypothetical protein CFAM422_007517 [Trichoderma lentiforme]
MDHTLISVLDILYGGAADIFSHRGKDGILTVVAWTRHCLDLMRHTVGQMADLAVRYERDPVLVVVATQFIRAESNLGVSSPDAGMRTTAPGSGRET